MWHYTGGLYIQTHVCFISKWTVQLRQTADNFQALTSHRIKLINVKHAALMSHFILMHTKKSNLLKPISYWHYFITWKSKNILYYQSYMKATRKSEFKMVNNQTKKIFLREKISIWWACLDIKTLILHKFSNNTWKHKAFVHLQRPAHNSSRAFKNDLCTSNSNRIETADSKPNFLRLSLQNSAHDMISVLL